MGCRRTHQAEKNCRSALSAWGKGPAFHLCHYNSKITFSSKCVLHYIYSRNASQMNQSEYKTYFGYRKSAKCSWGHTLLSCHWLQGEYFPKYKMFTWLHPSISKYITAWSINWVGWWLKHTTWFLWGCWQPSVHVHVYLTQARSSPVSVWSVDFTRCQIVRCNTSLKLRCQYMELADAF